MKKVLGVVVIIVLALAAYVMSQLDEHVHSERWRVKTLGDRFAADTSVRFSTIAEQCSMPAPNVSEEMRRQGGERTVYTVHANLIALKKEIDNDYHLVLEDPATHARMIAEIPDTDNDASANYHAAYIACRRTIDSLAGKPGFFTAFAIHKLEKPIPLNITGIGFFDDKHLIPQEGMAKNCREIHPVLKITTE